MANSANNFRETVDRLKALLAQRFPSPDGERNPQANDWLRTLYETYTARFAMSNGTVWLTGSIMIPLSLAGFAALATLQHPTFPQLAILAIASSAVMGSWLVVSENHRAFQDKSLAWLIAIEETLGLVGTGPVKIRGNWLSRALTFPAAIQVVRWVLTACVVVAWLLVLAFWPR